jgi:hypothetical protein
VQTARISAQAKVTLLATVRVEAVNKFGISTLVRALLDQGSEFSFISESIVPILSPSERRAEVSLTGIGSCKAGTVRDITTFELRSLYSPKFLLPVDTYVLPELSLQIPATNLVEISLNDMILSLLADQQFNKSGFIDIILDTDIYGRLLCEGIQSIPETQLIAQNTVLGWILSSSISFDSPRPATTHSEAPFRALHCSSESKLIEVLNNFWKLEEVSAPRSKFTSAKLSAEKSFAETNKRDAEGQFVDI